MPYPIHSSFGGRPVGLATKGEARSFSRSSTSYLPRILQGQGKYNVCFHTVMCSPTDHNCPWLGDVFHHVSRQAWLDVDRIGPEL